MTNEQREKLELLRRALPDWDNTVINWLAIEVLPTQYAHAFVALKDLEARCDYIDMLLQSCPSPEALIKSLFDETFPASSEEFRRDTARAAIHRLREAGYLIVGQEEK